MIMMLPISADRTLGPNLQMILGQS